MAEITVLNLRVGLHRQAERNTGGYRHLPITRGVDDVVLFPRVWRDVDYKLGFRVLRVINFSFSSGISSLAVAVAVIASD